jgi:hypothetical protein
MRDWVKKPWIVQLKGCIVTEQRGLKCFGVPYWECEHSIVETTDAFDIQAIWYPPPIQMLDWHCTNWHQMNHPFHGRSAHPQKPWVSNPRQIGKHLIVTQLLTVLMEFRTTYVKSMGNIQSAHMKRESSSDVGLKVNKYWYWKNWVIIYGLPRWREEKTCQKNVREPRFPVTMMINLVLDLKGHTPY